MANYNNYNTPAQNLPSLNVEFKVNYPKWAADQSSCRFSLDLPTLGITLHGLKLTRKKSDNTPCIVPPSFKGSGKNAGKWYSHYFVRFSPEMQDNIIAALCQISTPNAYPAAAPAPASAPAPNYTAQGGFR